MKHLPLAVALLALAVAVAFSGDLNPPAGPVQGTFKTLDQVEPSTPIGPDTTPGDDTAMFEITEPGSYYFVSDLLADPDKTGIRVFAPDVTIDMRGFTFTGVDSSNTPSCISTDDPADRFELRNGTIRGWNGSGLRALGDDIRVTDMRFEDNRVSGVSHLGWGAVIERCEARRNNNLGFRLGSPARVRSCLAEHNVLEGFQSFSGNDSSRLSVFHDCIAIQNGFTNGEPNGNSGFAAFGAAEFISCVASENGSNGFFGTGFTSYRDCVARLNTRDGFDVGGSVRIVNSSAFTNGEDGIDVGEGSYVSGCLTRFNGAEPGPGGAGFVTTGDGSRFEDNHSYLDEIGFSTTGVANIFRRNTVREASFQNYSIVVGNHGHYLNAAPNGTQVAGDFGGAPLSADPEANLSLNGS